MLLAPATPRPATRPNTGCTIAKEPPTSNPEDKAETRPALGESPSPRELCPK